MRNVAQSVRLRKEKSPADYCRVRKCLFRTRQRDGSVIRCPSHPNVIDLMQALRESLAKPLPVPSPSTPTPTRDEA